LTILIHGKKEEGIDVYCSFFPTTNILVPQIAQTPCTAGFPFFKVVSVAFFISLLVLHLTQKPSMSVVYGSQFRIYKEDSAKKIM